MIFFAQLNRTGLKHFNGPDVVNLLNCCKQGIAMLRCLYLPLVQVIPDSAERAKVTKKRWAG